MKRAPLCLLPLLLILASCGTTTRTNAENVLGRTADNLDSSAAQAGAAGADAQADLYTEAANLLRSVPLGTLADENGVISLVSLHKAIATAVGDNPELSTVVAGGIAQTLREQGVPESQIAMWVAGVSVLTLILRKVVPMAVAGGSGTPMGSLLHTLFGLFWSHSTWDKRKNGQPTP